MRPKPGVMAWSSLIVVDRGLVLVRTAWLARRNGPRLANFYFTWLVSCAAPCKRLQQHLCLSCLAAEPQERTTGRLPVWLPEDRLRFQLLTETSSVGILGRRCAGHLELLGTTRAIHPL